MKKSHSISTRLAALSVLSLLVVGAWQLKPARADLEGPSSKDGRVARAVTIMIRNDHISRKPLDDEISKRCFKSFLDTLDPGRLYFYQSDVDKLSQSKLNIDDMVQRGDISFAYDVFATYLQRVDERLALADELLKQDFDFTLDEEMVKDPDEQSYAANEQEARERWRKRIKYDLLVFKSQDKEKTDEAAREKLHSRYNSFASRMHQVSSDELLEMYLTALSTSFDPHTSYMSPRTLENFRIQMRLELEGIGAALRSEDGETIVTKIIPGGAADRQGDLRPEDRVVGVGQEADGEVVDTIDMKLSDVVNLIRGKKGTVVRLKVVHNDDPVPVFVAIERDKIELKDSEARSEIFEEGSKPDGTPYRIGVIVLPSFYMDMAAARLRKPDYKSTSRDVEKILDDFRAKDVDSVVVDLRKNGGGALEEAIKLTGLFIDRGPVVQVKNANGEVEAYQDRDRGTAWDGPLVVMIDKFSASASEIFAGAIQDYGRGLVIGDRSTHGKGTVQSLKDLGWEFLRDPSKNFGALKITMQQFYRPNGDSTQNRGVLSDIELPSLSTYYDVGEADLDFALEFDHVDPASYPDMKRVSKGLIDELKGRSDARTRDSEDFIKSREKIGKYLAQKTKKTVNLNEEKFLAERRAFDEDGEKRRDFEEAENNDDSIERDYYIDEALAITLDYTQLLDAARANLSNK